MIECKGLSFSYENGSKALQNIDFSTSHGGIIGLIGANGAGKSTLFKCMTGLVKPTEGCVEFKGKRLEYSKHSLNELRQQVNVVLQDPDRQIFFPRVFDDVAFGPRNMKKSKEMVDEAVMNSLCLTKMEELKDRPVHALSFGQKKRTAIAGILAMNCQMMICDEPEAGLDPQMKRAMTDILKKLAESGTTIVLSSHNMDLILELCDFVYVLGEGQIMGKGETLSVLSNKSLMESAALERPLLIELAEQLNLPFVRSAKDWEAVNTGKAIGKSETSSGSKPMGESNTNSEEGIS